MAPVDRITPFSSLMRDSVQLLVCPECGSSLRMVDDCQGLVCEGCGREFDCLNGIPLLYCESGWHGCRGDVTDRVKAFYEQNPFPNYDAIDSPSTLKRKAILCL